MQVVKGSPDDLAEWPAERVLEHRAVVGSIDQQATFVLRLFPTGDEQGMCGLELSLQEPMDKMVEVSVQATVGEVVRSLRGQLGVAEASGQPMEGCEQSLGWTGSNAFSCEELMNGGLSDGCMHIEAVVTVESWAGKSSVEFEEAPVVGGLADELAVKFGRGGLARDLARVLTSGENADTTIVASGREFKAHATVLLARSPKLKELLFEAARTSGTRNFHLDLGNIGSDAFALLLRHMYTDEVPTGDCSAELVSHLLSACELLQVPSLEGWCETKMQTLLTPETAPAMLVLAEQRGADALKCAALRFSASHVDEVTASRGWRDLMGSSPGLATEVLRTAVGCKRARPPSPSCQLTSDDEADGGDGISGAAAALALAESLPAWADLRIARQKTAAAVTPAGAAPVLGALPGGFTTPTAAAQAAGLAAMPRGQTAGRRYDLGQTSGAAASAAAAANGNGNVAAASGRSNGRSQRNRRSSTRYKSSEYVDGDEDDDEE